MRSNLERRPGMSSKDWFIQVQEELMCNKRSLIKYLNKDLAYMLVLRERTEDSEQEALLNIIIHDEQYVIRRIGQSMVFNRRMIHERKQQLRNNKFDRDGG